MSRRELRERIFLLLFRVEFNRMEDMPEQIQLFFSQEESESTEEEKRYISGKYGNIAAKLPEIDALINERAKGWSVERMGKVDITIIRLAVYEICYDDDIPTGVAINEAVELAKKFGQDESAGFVNGVLAKFA
ncbi:MAG: transcription antitermination factor NusB [Lachnospiraceae bacterium]|nr:transcription antitermination factor NusB [Lachnospiraceae bacterium]MBD5483452.1 transcription antitermination factor NusB [Lachnospiraceae bacterium]MBD5533534.1 transcription antitermination factor NusB [Lachnospiraceae bacterium]MDE5820560.1 transcription antitermination factor NusB [Lachnospiraceae bacterium]